LLCNGNLLLSLFWELSIVCEELEFVRLMVVVVVVAVVLLVLLLLLVG